MRTLADYPRVHRAIVRFRAQYMPASIEVSIGWQHAFDVAEQALCPQKLGELGWTELLNQMSDEDRMYVRQILYTLGERP